MIGFPAIPNFAKLHCHPARRTVHHWQRNVMNMHDPNCPQMVNPYKEGIPQQTRHVDPVLD